MPPRRKSEDDESPVLPPPEQNPDLIGHEAAEAELLSGLASGRLHHAWMLVGPKGVGKATLAFRFARFLLRHGRDPVAARAAPSLAVPESDPIARQVASLAAQDLLVLRRPVDEKTGRVKTAITVDEVRRLQPFFGLAAGADGWRIAIIDSIDELNRNAANALLKSLEEPPQRALIFLISEVPGRTLATIRSRCRTLHLSPLPQAELITRLPALGKRFGLADLGSGDRARLAELAGGCVGRALDLWASGGLGLAKLLDETLMAWPDLSPQRTAGWLDRARDDFPTAAEMLVASLRKAARNGATGAGEGGAAARLAQGAPPAVWAELASELESLFARGEPIHLDERMMLGEALRRIAGAAQRPSPL